MKLYEFSREILSISEQYLKLRKFSPTDKDHDENLIYSNLMHFHLASVWKELNLEQKKALVFNAEYAAVGDSICEMDRMLLGYYCSKDYAKEALDISLECFKIKEDGAESLANN